MSALTTSDVVAGAVGLLVGVAGGLPLPAVLRRLPEPEPDPSEPDASESDADAVEDETASGSRLTLAPVEAKPLYADLARTRGLAAATAIGAGMVGALFGASIGWHPALLVLVPLAPVGVALGWIDWRTTYLPTRIIAPTYPVLIVAVLLASTLSGDWYDARRAAIGWAVFGLIYLVLWLPGGMGYGDVRLSGLLGIALGYLGWAPLLIGLVGSFFLGGVGGLVLVLLRLVHHRRSPFGPWMLLAGAIAAVWGEQLAGVLGY